MRGTTFCHSVLALQLDFVLPGVSRRFLIPCLESLGHEKRAEVASIVVQLLLTHPQGVRTVERGTCTLQFTPRFSQVLRGTSVGSHTLWFLRF